MPPHRQAMNRSLQYKQKLTRSESKHDGGSSYIAIDYCSWCGKKI